MNDNVVYSTETGRIKIEKHAQNVTAGDGIIRIQRQVSGRKGKGVSVISGFGLPKEELTKIAAKLKKRCGCGGAVKGETIEIQGENRELLKQLLEEDGFKVKLSGG